MKRTVWQAVSYTWLFKFAINILKKMSAASADIYDYVNDLLHKSSLFVFALPEEAGEEFRDEEVLFTGVGKINAAHSLTKRLLQNKYDLVINLGSAGSNTFKKGS